MPADNDAHFVLQRIQMLIDPLIRARGADVVIVVAMPTGPDPMDRKPLMTSSMPLDSALDLLAHCLDNPPTIIARKAAPKG